MDGGERGPADAPPRRTWWTVDTGEHPPVGSGGDHRRSLTAPWRAAARLASRDVRRRPWRSVLVGVLVGLPVAALAAGVVLVRTYEVTPAEQWVQDFGQADAVVSWGGGATDAEGREVPADPGRAEVMAALRRSYPAADEPVTFARGPDGFTGADGHLHSVEVSDAPLANPVFAGSFELTHGRLPERPGEAAVTRAVLDDAGVHIGDRLELLLLGREVVITGTILDAGDYDGARAVITERPATHPDTSAVAYVTVPGVDGSASGGLAPGDPRSLSGAGAAATFTVPRGSAPAFAVFEPAVDPARPVAFFTVMAGVALLIAAIVASAAFAVGARRQLRLLGIVAAAGGSPADLRRAVLLEGTVTGVVTSLAGLGVAMVGTAAAYPLFDDLAGRRVDPLAYPPFDLAVAVALGVVSATAAAWLPARSAGRLPTLAALAGRRPPARVPAVVPVLGAMAVAAGVAALGLWARGYSYRANTWSLGLTGAVAIILGATAITPLLVTYAEPLAGRLRRGGRLAARALARQRLRSSAVVAAVMAPVGVTVLVACVVVTDEARSRATWEDDLAATMDVDADEVLYYALGASSERPDDTVLALRAALPGAVEVPVRMATAAPEPDAPPSIFSGLVRLGIGSDEARYDRSVVVTDTGILEAAGAAPETVAAFEAGRVIIPGQDLDSVAGGAAPSAPTIVTLSGVDATLGPEDLLADPGLDVPNGNNVVMVTAATAEGWGATVTSVGILFVVPEPLDGEQAAAVSRIASGSDGDGGSLRQYLLDPEAVVADGGYVQTGAWRPVWHDDSLPIRLAAVGASLVLTLAVVAAALALTAAESADDNHLLEAIGSPPSVRRSVAAWQATLLPAMAVTLAVPIALVVAAVVLSEGAAPTDIGPQVPWLTVAGLALLLPLASGGITWVGATFTGRRRQDLAAAIVGVD